MERVGRILHVDADQQSRERAASTLRRVDSGFNLIGTASVSAAKDRLDEETFDCVVSEIDLPDSDGLALLDHVRESSEDLPFVLFTGDGSESTAEEAFDAGATDYLPKGGGGYRALARRLKRLVGRLPASAPAGESEVTAGNYRTLIDTVPGIVYRAEVEIDWPFEFVDGACEAITGYTSVELREEVNWGEEIIHPDDREWVYDEVVAALDAGEPFEVTYRIQTRLGEVRWLWERGQETDRPGIIEGFISDITEHKRREQAAERERERFSDLFENFPEPTVAYGFDNGGKTVFLDVNDAFKEVFEFEKGNVLGERINDVIVPERERDESADIDQRIESGDLVDREVRRRTATEDRLFHLRSIPVSVGGEIDGFAVYTDITDRKNRQQELERYETIVETMPMGILVVDDEGRIVNLNQPAAGIIGYEVSDLLDQSFMTFVEKGIVDESTVDIYNDATKKMLSPMYNKDKEVLEREVTRADGENRHLEVHISLLPHEESFNGSVQVYHDITDRRQNERELRRQNERLEEFASIVSHDLRNPLNIAQGHLDLLARETDSDHVETVAGALERMETLIGETLELARQGEMVTETEPLVLHEIVEGCWEMVATGDATLEREAEATIYGDPERVKQLFENLFRNAVEHGGPDVTITVGRLDDGFFLADDGPGIPADKREDVFETGHTTIEDGTGFGLPIVKGIVEAHDWTIRIAESEAGGARFEITGVDISE